MESSRRAFLTWLVPATVLCVAPYTLHSQEAPPRPVRPPSSPPKPPLHPRKSADENLSPAPDPHAVLKSYDKDIKKNIQKLLELAQELKKEVDKTDSSEVLNLSMVRKAEEIEKLAHKIQTLARS